MIGSNVLMKIAKTKKQVIAACIVAFCATLVWASVDKGTLSAETEVVTTGVRDWRALAEQGDAEAQYVLAFIFAKGRGVKQNFSESARWLEKAADQGHPSAQHYLGLLYVAGKGVPKDRVQAYMWLKLASMRLPSGKEKRAAMAVRDLLAKEGPYAQIAEGRRRARVWSESHGEKQYR